MGAQSEAQRRLLDDLVVLEAYDDSAVALRNYAQFHHQRPERELYVLHTSQREPMIGENRGQTTICTQGGRRLLADKPKSFGG